MLEILATGGYCAAIDDDCPEPDLRDELARACHQRLRRIDRFTQLCLIGSHRCVGDTPLDPQTGLYLGSRFASVSNTISVHTQMIEHGHVPKPANFINTLSNSAGFYVGKNLHLDGKNLFVSRVDASTEAVLQIARLDLASAQVQTVLLGIVDEVPQPLAHHRLRLGVAPGTPLSEASHWFLLRAANESSAGDDTPVLGRISGIATLGNSAAAEDWLRTHTAAGPWMVHYSAAGNGSYLELEADGMSELLAGLPRYLPLMDDGTAMRFSPARTAGVLSAFVQDDSTAPTLLSLHRDSDGRYHVLRIDRQRQ